MIVVDDSSESILSSPVIDPNTTSQSLRKSVNIPNLQLHKIASSEANDNKPRQPVHKPQEISSARSNSIFDRDTFA